MKAILFLFFLASSFVSLSQTKYPLQPAVEGFEYIEVVRGENKRDLPLLIAFHYSSSKPDETVGDYDSLKYPVRLIVPRGKYEKRSGFSYFTPAYYQKDSATQFAEAKNAIKELAEFVKAIEKKFGQKAIVGGASQGGDIAFLLAIYYPELCKASFAVAAVIPTKLVEESKGKTHKQVPVFLYQGEDDKIVDISYTRQKLRDLKGIFLVTLSGYADLGHDISPAMKSDYCSMIDWINKKE